MSITTLKYTLALLISLFSWTYNLLANDKLVILSPHWEGIQDEFTYGFSTWYKSLKGRGVDIEWMGVEE